MMNQLQIVVGMFLRRAVTACVSTNGLREQVYQQWGKCTTLWVALMTGYSAIRTNRYCLL